MIKLTDEQIDAKTQNWSGLLEVPKARLVLCREYARAIEAEVLRINGITDHIGDANKMVERRQLIEMEQRARLRERFKNRDPSPATADFDLPHACVEDVQPRATGCPDTMDETAEIAVALKQAAEEKSPPATGPAG